MRVFAASDFSDGSDEALRQAYALCRSTSGKLAVQSSKFGAPGAKAAETTANRVETWHYRREALPKGVPFQQVDFDFVTKKGYGENVLNRDANVMNTLGAARP